MEISLPGYYTVQKTEFTLKVRCHMSIHLQQAPQDDRPPDRGGAPDLQCENIKKDLVSFSYKIAGKKREKKKRHRHSHILQYLFLNCNVRTLFCSSCFYHSPLSSSSSFSISYYSSRNNTKYLPLPSELRNEIEEGKMLLKY